MIEKLNERIEEELEKQFPFDIALEENNRLRGKIAVLTGDNKNG